MNGQYVKSFSAPVSDEMALVAGGTKFVSGEPLFQVLGFDVRAGSWIVIVLIPFLILNFLAIHRHYKLAADDDFISDVQTRVERRFPAFAGMKLMEAYAALYDVTPDWHPVLSLSNQVQGLFIAAGFSGQHH